MYHRGLPQGAVILSRTQHAFFAEEFDTLENLLEEGWDINSPIIPEDEDYTPLHYAALNEMFDIIQFLVKHGADVNAKTDDGETALDIAKREGYSDIVLFLEKYTNKI